MYAQSSDPRADRTQQFHAIYRREFAFVWACARRLGVAPAAVDDAVQDVFLTAYRRLDHLHYEVSPRAWLYAVTRRVASHYRRGASRRARKVEALRHSAAAPDAPQQRLDAARQLDALLTRLTPNNRAVFELVELLGMSGPEVAAELGEPLNTVYSRLRVARAQLQESIAATQLDAAIAEKRLQDAPPAQQEQRSWALVVPLLGRPAASLGLGAALLGRVAIATTLIAAGTAAVIFATSRDAPAPTPASPAPIAARSTPTASVTTEDVSRAPITGDLAREVALLDRARARLVADAPADALALLATHAAEFPHGALADAREATRVEALCRRGETLAAESVARALQRRYPTSAIARRLENFSCDR